MAGYPPYVKSPDKRREYDELVLAKDFPAAANLGAWMHGNGDKTSVHWNEVLANSLLAVSTGQGAALDDGLLHVLSQVWWPKHRRKWAKNILASKNGGAARGNALPSYKPETPAWAKLE